MTVKGTTYVSPHFILHKPFIDPLCCGVGELNYFLRITLISQKFGLCLGFSPYGRGGSKLCQKITPTA